MDNILNILSTYFQRLGRQINAALFVDDRWKIIVEGLGNTLVISFFALLIGVVVGVFFAILKVSAQKNKYLTWFSKLYDVYVNILRGTPIVVQLMIMYYVIFVSVDNPILVAVISFGLNSSAYVAEIVRAGIVAVDVGQVEAGRSLGLTSGMTMRKIILPQAIKNILPALGNEFIALVKETSVAGYIAINDLTKAGELIRTRTYDAFIPLIIVALVYLVIVLALTAVVKSFERRLARSDRG